MIFSISSALVASVLALLTFLLGNPRDTKGNLSKLGYATVALICCAAILNGASVYLNHLAAEDLSTDVRRSLHSLEEIEIRFWADLPLDGLGHWKSRGTLSAIFHKLISRHELEGIRETENAEISRRSGKVDSMKPTELRLTPTSGGYPSKDEDPVLFHLLNSNQIRIKLFREGQGSADQRLSRYARPFFSLVARVPSTPPVENTTSTSLASHVTYHLETERFVYESASFQVPRNSWREAGSHLSLLDFVGGHLVVDPFQSGSRFVTPGVDRARSAMRLRTLMISVKPGGYAYFGDDSWTEHLDEDGFPIYEIALPTTEDEIKRLFRLAD